VRVSKLAKIAGVGLAGVLCVGAFAEIRSPGILRALSESLAELAVSTAPGDRPGAVEMIESLLPDWAGTAERRTERTEARLARRAKGPDPIVRERLRKKIEEAERAGEDPIRVLADALRDPSQDMRESAIDELEQRDDRYAGEALVEQLAFETNPFVRAQMVDALSEIGGPEGAEGIAKGLKDPDQDVQDAATDALPDLADEGGPAALETLVEALRHPNPDVRAEAISGLETMADNGNIGALRALGDYLPAEPLMDLREQAIDALDYVGGSEALRVLAGLLSWEQETDLRVYAIEKLESYDGSDVLAAVTAALDDESYDVREASLAAIYHIGDAAAVEALARRYHSEPDPDLQAEILSLLDHFEADPSILFQ
jgi:HEAT repeat protein